MQAHTYDSCFVSPLCVCVRNIYTCARSSGQERSAIALHTLTRAVAYLFNVKLMKCSLSPALVWVIVSSLGPSGVINYDAPQFLYCAAGAETEACFHIEHIG